LRNRLFGLWASAALGERSISRFEPILEWAVHNDVKIECGNDGRNGTIHDIDARSLESVGYEPML